MNEQCILIHYHEIGLKGDNRSWFEKIFINNIKRQLQNLPHSSIKIIAARIFIFGIKSNLCEEYNNCLKNVMGLKHAFIMSVVTLNEDMICDAVTSQVKQLNFSTFRISTKRQDKAFHLTSQDINKIVGAKVVEIYSKKVNLNHPDLNIVIELVNGRAYVGYKKIPGYGGLPVGSGEKALSLISSGIDSPVSSFLLSKRGVDVSYIHFNSVPSTSMQSVNNVKKILLQLSKYQINCDLYNVPLLNIQEVIMENVPSKYWVIFFRRSMYSIANLLADKLNINALITGENVGQVASQTISNIRATSELVSIPVLRPLAGMNKEEIINIANDIGTYEISVQPYEDCCSFFVPSHPSTSANLKEVHNIESKLALNQLHYDLVEQLSKESISFYEEN